MKLEDQIRESIYRYPTLYRARNYAESRLLVLDHLFLCIGTGYEWSEEGYLFHDVGEEPPKYGEQTFGALPEGFFEKKLYSLKIEGDRLAEFKAELGDRFYYVEERTYTGIRIVFEAPGGEEEATPFFAKYGERGPTRFVFCNAADAYTREEDNWFHPYPTCDYSPIQEIFEGKTNSLHIDNFEFTKIQPDWLQGAVDIAIAAKEYYEDAEKCKSHTYHPEKSDYRSRDYKQLSGYIEGETKEEFMWRTWEAYRQGQLEFFNAFLEKYADEQGKIKV
jgi:hypothetical protein